MERKEDPWILFLAFFLAKEEERQIKESWRVFFFCELLVRRVLEREREREGGVEEGLCCALVFVQKATATVNEGNKYLVFFFFMIF